MIINFFCIDFFEGIDVNKTSNKKIVLLVFIGIFKNTQSSLNKILALPTSINIDIWVIGTLKQLFVRGS